MAPPQCQRDAGLARDIRRVCEQASPTESNQLLSYDDAVPKNGCHRGRLNSAERNSNHGFGTGVGVDAELESQSLGQDRSTGRGSDDTVADSRQYAPA